MKTGLARLWKPALLLAGLLLGGLALRTGAGRQALDAPAQLGPAGFVAIAALACALGVPRQVAAYAAGLGFGLWGGVALAMAAQLLGCAADFVWARAVARDWARRRVHGRLGRLDKALQLHPFTTTLTLRLLPVGSNLLLNFLAGASAVAAGPFLLASALGYLPQTLIFVLLGGGIRIGQDVQLGIGIALFAVASLAGLYLLRRTRLLP